MAYVAPGFAVVYGVALLDESFTLSTLAGLLLIVGGSWLAAEGRGPGARRVRRGRRSGSGGGHRQLPAGGVDVAAAGQPHRGRHAAFLAAPRWNVSMASRLEPSKPESVGL